MLDAGLHEDIGDDLEAQESVEIYGMELGIKPYLRIAEAALCHFAASSHHLSANALSSIGGSGRHTAYLDMLLQWVEIDPGIGDGNSLAVLFCCGKDMYTVFVRVVKVGIDNLLFYEEHVLPQFQYLKQLASREVVEMECLYLYSHVVPFYIREWTWLRSLSCWRHKSVADNFPETAHGHLYVGG